MERQGDEVELVRKQLPPDHRIYLFSDLHEGSSSKCKRGVAKMVDAIASDKNAWAICGGDVVEGITIDDKRYQADAVDADSSVPLMQYQNAIKELMPIKGKIICILEGNHDWKISSRIGSFIKHLMCKDLDAAYGTYTAKVSVSDKRGRSRHKIFYTHGAKSLTSNAKDPIQRAANIAATLKSRLSFLAGDCATMAQGHTHQNFIVPPTKSLYITDDGAKITQHYTTSPGNTKFIHPDHRWYCSTGSFLKLYGKLGTSGYAERAGYAPVELGYSIVHVEGYRVVNCEKVVV